MTTGRAWRIWAAAVGTGLASVAWGQATAPATRPATQPAAQAGKAPPVARAALKAAFPFQGPQVETVEVESLADVFQLRVENGLLVGRTTLPTVNGQFKQVQIKLKGVAQPIHVSVMGPDNPGRKPVVPQHLNFSLSRTGAGADQTSVSLSLSQDMLQLSRYSTRGNMAGAQANLSVSHNFRMTGMPDVVSLSLSNYSNPNNPVQEMVSAPTFEAFRRQHPKAVDEHLRPLFRDLGQEGLLIADPCTAWQVFASDYRPDAKVGPAVEKLVAELGDPDFKARDDAEGRLRALGHDAALVALRLDRRQLNLDAEQRARLDAVLAPYQLLKKEEADRLRDDPTFLMDCLATDDPHIPGLALERLSKLTGETLELDLKATGDARLDAIAKLRPKVYAKLKK